MVLTVKPMLGDAVIHHSVTDYDLAANLLEMHVQLFGDSQVSIVDITVDDSAGTYTSLFEPGDIATVSLGKTSPFTTVFVGPVDRTLNTLDSKGNKMLKISCVDYGQILQNRLLNVAYHDAAGIGYQISDIVKDIVTKDSLLLATQSGLTIPTGVTTNNVQTVSQRVVDIVFNKMPIQDALKQLADMCLASFYVDSNKDLHFYVMSTLTSSVILDESISRNVLILGDGTDTRNGIYVDGADFPTVEYANNTDTGSINLDSQYYAQQFTPASIRLSFVAAKAEQVGSGPRSDLRGEIRQDNSNTPQGGATLILFSTPYQRIPAAGAADWVLANAITDLDTNKKYWIIFYKTGTASVTYKIKTGGTGLIATSADGVTWTPNGSGALMTARTYTVARALATLYDQASIAKYGLRETAIRDPNITTYQTADAVASGQAQKLTKKKRTLSVDAMPTDTLIKPGEMVNVVNSELGLNEFAMVIGIEYDIIGNECWNQRIKLLEYVG